MQAAAVSLGEMSVRRPLAPTNVRPCPSATLDFKQSFLILCMEYLLKVCFKYLDIQTILEVLDVSGKQSKQ